MAEIPWTADELETMFHAALADGDVRGVEAALSLLARVDAHRASDLYDALKVGVALAQEARGG